MYFTEMVQLISVIPDYLIDDALKLAKINKAPVTEPGERLSYPMTALQGVALLEGLKVFNSITSYLLSLGTSYLRETILTERGFSKPTAEWSDQFYGSRYCERVGEKVVIPLDNPVSYAFASAHVGDITITLDPGKAYRVNNRTLARVKGSSNTMVLKFLDIDLNHYLTGQDKNGIFELSKEEG